MILGDDFEQLSQVLNFPIGTTSISFTYGTLNDDINEELEFFTVGLMPQTDGLMLGTNDTAQVDIDDDDGKYVISCNSIL